MEPVVQDPNADARIALKRSFEQDGEARVRLVNYKKNGAKFANLGDDYFRLPGMKERSPTGRGNDISSVSRPLRRKMLSFEDSMLWNA